MKQAPCSISENDPPGVGLLHWQLFQDRILDELNSLHTVDIAGVLDDDDLHSRYFAYYTLPKAQQ